MKILLIDTGPLVAYFDESERHHEWAVDVLSEIEARAMTSQPVVAEVWHLLGRAGRGQDALLSLIADGLLEIDFDLPREVTKVRQLIRRYANVPMSLADASMVRLAEVHRAPVCTLDSDFRIYRLRGRAPIDIIAPF